MRIDVSLNAKSLASKLARMERDLPTQIDTALFATAQYGIENIILARTQKGQGIDGIFKPYTPKYALFRKEKGRGTRVDLNFTGAMLGSMTATKHRGYAEINFGRGIESKKAYFNNQRRPFFGFNRTERSKLVAFMKRRLFK